MVRIAHCRFETVFLLRTRQLPFLRREMRVSLLRPQHGSSLSARYVGRCSLVCAVAITVRCMFVFVTQCVETATSSSLPDSIGKSDVTTQVIAEPLFEFLWRRVLRLVSIKRDLGACTHVCVLLWGIDASNGFVHDPTSTKSCRRCDTAKEDAVAPGAVLLSPGVPSRSSTAAARYR